MLAQMVLEKPAELWGAVQLEPGGLGAQIPFTPPEMTSVTPGPRLPVSSLGAQHSLCHCALDF